MSNTFILIEKLQTTDQYIICSLLRAVSKIFLSIPFKNQRLVPNTITTHVHIFEMWVSLVSDICNVQLSRLPPLPTISQSCSHFILSYTLSLEVRVSTPTSSLLSVSSHTTTTVSNIAQLCVFSKQISAQSHHAPTQTS